MIYLPFLPFTGMTLGQMYHGEQFDLLNIMSAVEVIFLSESKAIPAIISEFRHFIEPSV